MMIPVLGERSCEIEKDKEHPSGIEERIYARGQEAGKKEIVKELLALD